MAQYTVNYTCKHSETVRLFGPESGRRSRIAWLERGVCPDCRREADRLAGEAAAKKAEAIRPELPEITEGSEKQIAWARAIRAAALPIIERVAGGTQQPEAIELCRRIRRQTRAKYWIDRRSEFASEHAFISYLKRRIAEDAAEAAGRAALKG